MNYALAKEIYGLTPWCVDSVSFQSLSTILQNFQNGVSLELPEVKYNTPQIYKIKSDTRIITNPYGNYYEEGQLENNDDFDGIGIINLNGPIVKSSGASTVGMESVSSYMMQMNKDKRIKSFIIMTDSGGGVSSAVQIMVDTINEIKKEKPVYALVTKGGMAGSAAYGIISAATKIYSEDKMNIVGSVGTMIQFSGKPHGNVDQDGEKTIVLYATKSTAKNKAFEEAVNNDNYELIVNDLLDPINENFISTVLGNRPQLKGSNFDDGHTVFSKDAVGTYIDGIASFDQVVNMIVTESKDKKKSVINNSNKGKMTKQEFKSEHPTVYAEIVSEGALNEKERVASWMVYQTADPEAVANGIASGESISASVRESLMVKMYSNKMISNLKDDNAADLTTPESKVKEDEVVGNKELEEAFKFKL